MPEPPTVCSEGWLQPPTDSGLLALTGEIVQVVVPGTVEPEGTPFGEFFRYARIISVAQLPRARPCPRCEEPSSRFRFQLVWERGYGPTSEHPPCEHCIVGRVVSGAHLVEFSARPIA